jgi:hypothetical protein
MKITVKQLKEIVKSEVRRKRLQENSEDSFAEIFASHQSDIRNATMLLEDVEAMLDEPLEDLMANQDRLDELYEDDKMTLALFYSKLDKLRERLAPLVRGLQTEGE